MVLDGDGWHTARSLRVPRNATLRERHLSHRLLDDHDAVGDALCRARNAPAPARLRFLAARPYLEAVSI